MPSKLSPDSWTPVEIDSLEPLAEEAVRSLGNGLIIAGPGAGKTELLAQRACFLLQTGLCQSPHRILAISFKRDAAANLHDRVLKRCGPELARRFDSMTFDAFAKGLLDRFGKALPVHWQPMVDYDLSFKISERNTRDLIGHIPDDRGGFTAAEVASISTERLYRTKFIGAPLPLGKLPQTTTEERAAAVLWEYLLDDGQGSTLNFHMIGRLSELILRSNPKILRALRATYRFVFLDEFQDTTSIQYDLTKTAFYNSDAILTAVGDNKQKIMGWAGALHDFRLFRQDFDISEPTRLAYNYRSAPEIVKIIGVLTKAIDPDAVTPVFAGDRDEDGEGECRVLIFENHHSESEWIADTVQQWIEEEELDPRDICILTRMRPGDYTESIRSTLADRGLEARVEVELQSILAEPITAIILDTLKFSIRDQAPESRESLLDLILEIRGGDPEHAGNKANADLKGLDKSLQGAIAVCENDPSTTEELLSQIVDAFGCDALGAIFPQYSQGSLLTDTIEGLAKALKMYLEESEDFSSALDAVEGVGSVPIMTMHKSKGLEYHSVIFVGLEDDAHWNFVNSEDEETRGFFVALSRAKYRVYFTFANSRPKYAGKRAQAQGRRKIGRLYDLLNEADIEPETIG